MYRVAINTLKDEYLQVECKSYNDAYNLASIVASSSLFQSVQVYEEVTKIIIDWP